MKHGKHPFLRDLKENRVKWLMLLPAAIVVGVCCLAVCMLARLLFFGDREAQILPGMLAMLAAAALGGIAGSTQRKPARRRRR